MLPKHILITQEPGASLAQFVSEKKYSQLLVITDPNTNKHCYSQIKDHLPAHQNLVVKAGEEHKNLETCVSIWQTLTDMQADRHALVVVLGGGVLGDMAGFCAATYKRGIAFILIPTTLLAQADASIGGKLGIDFNHYKNHIGVFQEPVLTILSSTFLDTLPKEELRSGFAEVIKHALISDASMWKEISSRALGEQNWDKLLLHSAHFKYSIIAQDPKEKGIRKILNAGHTIGHALESFLLKNGRKLMHGEAVAAGLIAEAFLAQERGLLSLGDLNNIKNYITQVFDKVSFNMTEIESVAAYALQDKKNKDNRIMCVLLNGIGAAQWDCEISVEDVKRALAFYLSN